MITLYHAARSRSIRPRWLLEEMGLAYDLKRLGLRQEGPDGTMGDDYAKVYRLQKVPVLIDGDMMMVESVAMLQYLTGKYGPTPLAPEAQDPEFAPYLQWLHFGEAGMGGNMNMLLGHVLLLPEERRIPAIAAWAEDQLMKQLDFVSEGLGDKEYLLARGFTAADISMGYMLYLLKLMRKLKGAPENIQAYWERLIARPGWQTASAD